MYLPTYLPTYLSCYQDAIQFTVDQTALTQTRAAKAITPAAVAVPSVASVPASHLGGAVAG